MYREVFQFVSAAAGSTMLWNKAAIAKCGHLFATFVGENANSPVPPLPSPNIPFVVVCSLALVVRRGDNLDPVNPSNDMSSRSPQRRCWVSSRVSALVPCDLYVFGRRTRNFLRQVGVSVDGKETETGERRRPQGAGVRQVSSSAAEEACKRNNVSQ